MSLAWRAPPSTLYFLRMLKYVPSATIDKRAAFTASRSPVLSLATLIPALIGWSGGIGDSSNWSGCWMV